MMHCFRMNRTGKHIPRSIAGLLFLTGQVRISACV